VHSASEGKQGGGCLDARDRNGLEVCIPGEIDSREGTDHVLAEKIDVVVFGVGVEFVPFFFLIESAEVQNFIHRDEIGITQGEVQGLLAGLTLILTNQDVYQLEEVDT
jgi:hypothetical protein